MSLFEGTEIMKKTASGVKPQRLIDDGEQWLTELVARAKKAPSGVITEVCALTPSRAQALLARNPENRNVSQVKVSSFADDILSNRWAFNGETIKISANGQLNDGQHRSLAVIECGHPIETLFVVGVARKTRFTNDMGSPRRVGDFLHMHGVTYSKLTASIAGALIVTDAGLRLSRRANDGTRASNANRRPTKSAILAYAREHGEEIQKAIAVIGIAQKIVASSRLAVALILIARATRSWEPAAQFVTSIIEGDNLKKNSPAYVVRQKLIEGRGKLSGADCVEIVLRGWNAHKQGINPMPRLKISGAWPTIAR